MLAYLLEIKCPPIDEMENGRVVGSTFWLNDSLSFHCMTGFFLTGSKVRTCGQFGRWSGALAVCDDKGKPRRTVMRFEGSFRNNLVCGVD